MTNETETPAPTPKRARTQASSVAQPPVAPSGAAQAAVSRAVASYPDPIQAITLSISKRFNALKSKARQQTLTRARLAVADFIPHSARIKFELKGSAGAMENDRFTALKTEMTARTEGYTKAIKAAIVEVGFLEKEAIENEMAKLFCTSAAQLAKLCLLEKDPSSSDPPHFELSLYCIEQDVANALLKHMPLSRPQLFQRFNELNDNGVDAHLSGSIPVALVETFTQRLLLRLAVLLKSIFVTSWEAQLAVYLQQERDIALAKQVREYMGGRATTAAVAIIDAEPTADPKTLRNLIETQVDAKTKSLRTEIQQLRQSVKRSSKKDPRGAPQPASASSTKKKAQQKGKTKQKSKQKRNDSDDSAGSNAKDTRSERSNSRKPSGKNNKKKKSGNSKPRGQQRSEA